MTEERFEQFLREASGGYNEPPEPPREDMWARIEEARRVIPIEPARRFTAARWIRWGTGIAAVLAVGIALGRLTAPAGPAASGADGRTPGVAIRQPAELTAGAGGRSAPGATKAMRLATARHLSETEAFLTLYRSRSGDAALDSSTVVWARQLLIGTRLRMDSRAVAKDPRLRILLEDLELVLAQIVQLDAIETESEIDEAEFIDQGIEQRQVLTRLRATLAGMPSLART
jgi:hypothetical protein